MTAASAPDHYEILGLDNDASSQDVKDAYKRLAKRAHPDAGGSAALFRMVEEAHRVLSDPASRRAYDATRRSSPRTNGTPRRTERTRNAQSERGSAERDHAEREAARARDEQKRREQQKRDEALRREREEEARRTADPGYRQAQENAERDRRQDEARRRIAEALRQARPRDVQEETRKPAEARSPRASAQPADPQSSSESIPFDVGIATGVGRARAVTTLAILLFLLIAWLNREAIIDAIVTAVSWILAFLISMALFRLVLRRTTRRFR